MESIEYSWKWVTADELLSHGPCELLYALFIPSDAATATAIVYNNGEASGEIVVSFRGAESRQSVFSPKKPVYCRKGLYVDCGSNTRGIFIQWRELGHKAG